MIAASVTLERVEIRDVDPAVSGALNRPGGESRGGIVLAHGAGSNEEAPLLRAVAEEFARAGWLALRCRLPSRQARPGGPPRPGDAARDQAGLRRAAEVMRRWTSGPVCLGGHSYGGRQSTLLLAEDPQAADGLLLLSYPLHPPDKPLQLRTAHFPRLRTCALFFHGTRDPFGTPDELRAALELVPARTRLELVEGAGHDLRKVNKPAVISAFFEFLKR
jgi:predicted alpha/beta-hydrolase family hydrolase